jgi:hypothetical protein
MSAAQPIGDREFAIYGGVLRLAPPPSLRSLRYEDPPSEGVTMLESDDPPAFPATLAPPTDRELPRAERPTEPPSAAEAEAAFRESQRAPRMQTQPAESELAKLVRTVGDFAIEAREGRAEIMGELRSVATEVAGIRHEATRTNQRLTMLERAFGDEVAKLKRQIKRALRRIEALEAAAKVSSVPAAPPRPASRPTT